MKTAGLVILLALLSFAAQAQCWNTVSIPARQKKLHDFLTTFWAEKPDTLATKHFRIEKPAYLLRLENRDDSPVYDSIEARLNQMVLCEGKAAEAWFIRNKSAAHMLVLTRLQLETGNHDLVDSLYYQYDVANWEGFAQKVSAAGPEGGQVLKLAALETAYRYRKDWFLKFGPDFIGKSAAPQADKEKMAEYLCRLGQCQYQEQLMDAKAPNFR